jgi:16S rRNA (uracil1498-N3)-methyltransferase
MTPGALLELPPAQGQHLARVLRLAPGAPVVLFNGEGGEFEGVIEDVRKAAVAVRLGAHHDIERESPLDVTLLQGIARGEKMDLILQKATELGVSRVVPLTCVRSTVRLGGETSARKQEHWQAVVASACEQCGRNRIPEVGTPASLAVATQTVRAGLKLLLRPDEDSSPIASLVQAYGAAGAMPGIALLVGPEGGFDPAEVTAAKMAGFVSCRLGPRVLRTETAGLAALAILQSMAGDMREG